MCDKTDRVRFSLFLKHTLTRIAITNPPRQLFLHRYCLQGAHKRHMVWWIMLEIVAWLLLECSRQVPVQLSPAPFAPELYPQTLLEGRYEELQC